MSRCTALPKLTTCTSCLSTPQGAPCADAPLLWHAQPPPEDDPRQAERWSNDADRQAFYTLYEKLLGKR